MADENRTQIATTMDEAGRVMSERAAIDGDDFRVKVLLRISPAGLNESIAILDGATVEQLTNPEAWLSRLCGGSGRGAYTFRIVHGKDRQRDQPIAIFMLPQIRGEPRQPDPRVVTAPDWSGPREVVFVSGQEAKSPNGASKSTLVDPAVPPPPGSTQAIGQGADGGIGLYLHQLASERERLSEQRHQMELEEIRRAYATDMKRLEAKFSDLMESLRSKPAIEKINVGEIFAKITAAATPLVASIAPLILEARKSSEERERARIDREETNRNEILKMMRESTDRAASASADQMKIVAPMVDAVAKMGQTVLQQVATFREMTQAPPPEDEGFMGVIKTAIAAWAETMARQPAQMPPSVPDPRLAQRSTPPPPRQPPPGPNGAMPSIDVTSPPVESNEGGEAEERMSPSEMLNEFARAISDREEPQELARDLVAVMKEDTGFVAAIQSAGGAIAVLRARLGDEWGNNPENLQYLQALFGFVGQIAQAEGVAVTPLFPQPTPVQ